MNLTLQRLFDILEAERLLLLEKVEPFSTEQFNRAPSGKWSLIQLLAHLITVEKVSVAYMNKKILGIREVGDTGIAEEAKMILLKISQRLPFKFKAPKIIIAATLTYSDFRQMKEDWDHARIELSELLEKFEEGQVKKKIYRHVVAGRLNIQHALIFLREHHLHHAPQIKRLL